MEKLPTAAMLFFVHLAPSIVMDEELILRHLVNHVHTQDLLERTDQHLADQDLRHLWMIDQFCSTCMTPQEAAAGPHQAVGGLKIICHSAIGTVLSVKSSMARPM